MYGITAPSDDLLWFSAEPASHIRRHLFFLDFLLINIFNNDHLHKTFIILTWLASYRVPLQLWSETYYEVLLTTKFNSYYEVDFCHHHVFQRNLVDSWSVNNNIMSFGCLVTVLKTLQFTIFFTICSSLIFRLHLLFYAIKNKSKSNSINSWRSQKLSCWCNFFKFHSALVKLVWVSSYNKPANLALICFD